MPKKDTTSISYDADNFRSMGDENVVTYAKEGSQNAVEYLLQKYRPIVESKARTYFLVGADHEDIVQEGMIGLFKAIRDFRKERMLPFRAFAELCVSRQIFTAIKSATRQKHLLLNSYISLQSTISDDDNEYSLIDTLEEKSAYDPEDILIGKQFSIELKYEIDKHLSTLEQKVLSHHLDGRTYQEIANILNRRTKSIDNALQRAKRKIEKTIAAKIGVTTNNHSHF